MSKKLEQQKFEPAETIDHGHASDFGHRGRWIWSLVFYAFFGGITIIALTLYELSSIQIMLMVLLVGTNGVLHWYVFLYWLDKRPNSGDYPYQTLSYLTATTLLWLLKIVFVHPVFVYAWMGFGGLFFFLLALRLAIIGFGLTYAVFIFITSGASLDSLSWRSPAIWISIGTITIGSGIAYWLQGIIIQSRERHTLIQELEATRADLAASERRAGILSERQRLAREIHDTVAQGFISIVMHLEAAEQALPPEQPVATRHISQARKTARESLGQARRVVEDLRPAPLEDATLPEAIREVVEKWERRGEETAVFTMTGAERPLLPQIEDTLLRAVQEALANVRKHAQAQSVTLTLSFIGDLVLLDVQDDGIGTEAAPQSAGGFGLTAMRQRVTRLGGSVTLESEPNSGTTLAVQIPI